MHTIDPQSWKQDLPAFREKTDEFYAGTLDKGARIKAFPVFTAAMPKRVARPVCSACA